MIAKTCKICGKLFKIRPCLINTRKHCSRKCYCESLKGKPSGNKDKKIEKICEVCGTVFYIVPSKINKRKRCSQKCYWESLKGKSTWNKGKKPSEEIRKKQRESRKNRFVGPNACHWKNGRTISHGYVMIYKPNHPFVYKNNYIKQSRHVMEKYLGRFLTSAETVHHINSKKSDDNIKNLYLFPDQSAHTYFHTLIRSGKIPPGTNPANYANGLFSFKCTYKVPSEIVI